MNNNSYHHRSSHHQGNVNRHNNNDNGSRITMTREREQDDWKRNKRNKQWKEKQPATSADQKEEQMPPKWSREEAIKAIEIENAFNHLQSNQFVLRFPDPFIDKSIIQGYSSAIVDVRVQQPITPR